MKSVVFVIVELIETSPILVLVRRNFTYFQNLFKKSLVIQEKTRRKSQPQR